MSKTTKNDHRKKQGNKTKITRPILDITRTAAKELFASDSRPWDAIPKLPFFIRELGKRLPYEEYDEVSDGIWVHISAYLSPSAKIESPTIICGGAKICHNTFISSSVIGSFASVGELSSVRNCVVFDRAKLCCHNSVSSSVIGYESILGANSVVADMRLDGMNVSVDMPEGTYFLDKNRIGAVICDRVKIGASAVINPGSVIDTECEIFPLTSVSGYVFPYTNVK